MQRHGSFEPFKSFREMAAHVPEIMQRPGQAGVTRWVGVGGPVERGAEIVVLGFQTIEPFQHVGFAQLGLGAFHERDEIVEMSSSRCIRALRIK